MSLPSREQINIIQRVLHKQNVIVDAVAGSGKTTTVLSLAKAMPTQRILQITYNSQLKNEVRRKAIMNEADNLEVHTYHSLAVKYYARSAHTDSAMKKALSSMKRRATPCFDVIVIDEAQDMMLLYYKLVQCFICDAAPIVPPKTPILVVFGDRYQGMYEFKGADIRFLTMAPEIWQSYGHFERMPLKTSYRVSQQIAWFVNACMLGSERLLSDKDGGYPVEYYKYNAFQVHSKIIPKLQEMLSSGEITPGDIFVLAYSLKSSEAPAKKMENALVNLGLPCYIPTSSDEAQIDEDIIKGKVVFSSFHQAKGRERPVVIVYGFDSNYFKYFDKSSPTDECPSTLYVAATRASKRLFLIEHDTAQPLPFLRMSHKQMKISGGDNFKMYKGVPKTNSGGQLQCIRKTSPTDLVKFINEATLTMLEPLVNQLFKIVQEPKESIDIPCKVQSDNGHFEEVWDINGLVIPAMWEQQQTGEICTIQRFLKCDKASVIASDKDHTFLQKHMAEFIALPSSPSSIEQYLYMGNVYHSVRHKVYHRLAQIQSYDWLTQDMVDKCHENMRKQIGDKAGHVEYEVELHTTTEENKNIINTQIHANTSDSFSNYEIIGIVDALDPETVWEFKCTNTLTIDHCLQTIIYAWLWKYTMVSTYGRRRFKLMNIRSAEIRELDVASHLLDQVVYTVIEAKYRENKRANNDIFLSECVNVLKGIT